MRELMTLYEAKVQATSNQAVSNQASALPEQALQYADVAVWQRECMSSEVLSKQLDYWSEQLHGAPPLLELPTDHPRPRQHTFQGSTETFKVSPELTQLLKELSQQAGATLFMSALAAFKVLLARYSGQQDIVVGTPIANRNGREREDLIGFFANTLVLRTQLDDHPTFLELLERVRGVVLDAYAHQDLPFEKLVELLQPEQNMSHSPLFQVMFILHNTPDSRLQFPGLTVEPLDLPLENTKFDLTLEIIEHESGLIGSLEYNTHLFEQATIERMIGHYLVLLEGIVANPTQRAAELPLLTIDERYKLLVEWNDTELAYPEQATIHELFEEQVKRTPNAVAVSFKDQTLTYQELNQRANQLAHHLRTLGVKPEVPVGISVERSLDMIVALLGVTKANGAYVPLDPKYPNERLAFMIEDAKVEYLLTQEHLLEQLPENSRNTKIVCLDRDWPQIAEQSADNLVNHLKPDNLFYIIYTSGSTGRPKGVMALHRGAINRFNWMWQTYPFVEGEVCCQKTTLNFVDSIWEIFGPLLKGVPNILIPDEMIKDPTQLVRFLSENEVSRIVLVPSLLRVMLSSHSDIQERLPKLKYWTTSGEALPVELYEQFQAAMPNAVLLNIYGSSEIAADATCYDTREQSNFTNVPIGRPISNMQVYLLDKNHQPVPIGLPGELYVGGVGLARGYAGRPDLTEERFIPNRFSDDPNVRLYKTGDLGKYLSDGNIEFVGRSDHQVKIRGFRIELGEIESVLTQHPAVKQVVIMARQDPPSSEKRLVAYLIGDLAIDRAVWNSECRLEFADSSVLDLPTVDLSWNGLGVRDVPIMGTPAYHSLIAGQSVRCRLQLPQSSEQEWFEGTIAWTDTQSKTAGILFQLTSSQREQLRESVKQLTDQDGVEVTDLRRSEPRLPLHSSCLVKFPDGSELELNTENISAGGMRLVLDSIPSRYKYGKNGLQTGVPVELRFDLPDKRKKISLKAKILWHHAETQRIGLQFETTPAQSKLLRQSVDYLSATQGLSVVHLRDYLKQHLLDYMVPSAFVMLDAFPLTPNGKINRLALPAPDSKRAEAEYSYVPPQNELQLQLTKIWEGLFDTRPIGIEDNFFDLGGHSLMAITLFAEIEKLTNKKLPLVTLLQAPTIEKLSQKLEDDGYKGSWSSLVPFQTGGSKHPFFYISPYLISVLTLTDMGRYMAPDRPFYGLRPQGLDGEEAIHTRIEDMAAHYIKEIKTIQPKGPYFLGGHCSGSWVAFEMAHKLKAQGEEVGALIIVDSEPPNFSPPSQNLSYYIKRSLHYLRDNRLFDAVHWQLKLKLGRTIGQKVGSRQERRIQEMRKIHDEAFKKYRAPIYSGQLIFLRSSEWHSLPENAWHMNWTKLTTGSVDMEVIPSTHAKLILEPNVKMLAEKIKFYLDREEKNSKQ